MSATRTQIYLSDEQRRRVDRAAAAKGISMAEVIRQALDTFLDREVDPTASLAATFGADTSASVPSRDSWQRG